MNYSKASRLLIGSVVVVALVSGPSLAFAKPGDLLQTFFNPTSDEGFSNSVAAVGNNVLVGAMGDGAGAVYMFEGIPEPATLSLPALLALSLPKRSGLALLRRKSGYGG